MVTMCDGICQACFKYLNIEELGPKAYHHNDSQHILLLLCPLHHQEQDIPPSTTACVGPNDFVIL